MKYDYIAPLEFMGTRPEVKKPVIKKELYPLEFWNKVTTTINGLTDDSFDYDRGFGRYLLKPKEGDFIVEKMLAESLEAAREVFKSDTLLPTYGLFSRYKGYRSNLFRHRDANACTYTLDVCISQKIDWPIVVEGVEYSLNPNEALCFYGEDQRHWRDKFTDKENNVVEMAFLHYAEPDHWFFTQGMDFYHKMIKENYRNTIM
jgi:hypothetical protein